MADHTIPRRRSAQSPDPIPAHDAAHGGGATVTRLVPRRILELVPPQPNAEVVELLTGLLRHTEAGAITGLVSIPLYNRGHSGKKFGVSLAGRAKTNPTLAAGAMGTCQMLVQEIALKDAGIA